MIDAGESTPPAPTECQPAPACAVAFARIWLWIALGLTLLQSAARLRHTFLLEAHGFALAHLALMARSFASHGVLALHGIPIMNAGVTGVHPDVYIHWPPLYFILVGMVVRVFGDSERTIFACGAVSALLFAGAWYWLLKRCGGTLLATACAYALLATPVFAGRAHIWTVAPCYTPILLSLHFAIAAWRTGKSWCWAAACAAATAATLVSWEALLLGPGILLAALLLRETKLARIALTICAGAALGAACFVAECAAAYPEWMADLIQTVRFRSGLKAAAVFSINTLNAGDAAAQPSAMAFLRGIYDRLVDFGMLPLFAMLAFAWYIWKQRAREPQLFVIFVSLSSIAAAWFAVFRNHIFFHDYQWLLLAPPAALGLGKLLEWLWLEAGRSRPTAAVQGAAFVLPLCLLLPLAASTAQSLDPAHAGAAQRDMFGNYARELAQRTPANAVIGSVDPSPVIPYYARRHIVRGVSNDRAVAFLAAHGKEFPGSPIYVAIPLGWTEDFPCSLRAFPQVRLTYSILLDLSQAPSARLDAAGCTGAPRHAAAW